MGLCPFIVSPEVAAGAASTRTEIEARLDAIARLYQDKAVTQAASDRFYGWHPKREAEDPEPEDRDSEDHFRWAMRKDRAIMANVRADRAVREACDSFFAWYEERGQ